MTEFVFNVLSLLARYPGGRMAAELGEKLWPNMGGGRNAKGGPSGQQCAVNWQLGKLRARKRWVEQEAVDSAMLVRVWRITVEGSAALRSERRRREAIAVARADAKNKKSRRGVYGSRKRGR